MDEFELIRRYWQQPFADLPGNVGEPGSDCALLRPAPGMDLAVSVDTYLKGVHFREHTSAEELGRFVLACALSDLAASAANPLGFTLALTLPELNEPWLHGLSKGMRALAGKYAMPLLGGDTVCGPLSITLQVFGQVPREQALSRYGARPGDFIYVSGRLGEAALRWVSNQPEVAPHPRIALGVALRGLASAAIDLSDGLLADAGHLARLSRCDIVVQADAVPLHQSLREHPQRYQLGMASGGDYELCFALPQRHAPAVEGLQAELDLPLTRIGECVAADGESGQVRVQGLPHPLEGRGFSHF